jgi:hypothetical protein
MLPDEENAAWCLLEVRDTGLGRNRPDEVGRDCANYAPESKRVQEKIKIYDVHSQRLAGEARKQLRPKPKYPAVNRWHIEKWLPPEDYGPPRGWYTQTVEKSICLQRCPSPPPGGVALFFFGAAGEEQIAEHGHEAGPVIKLVAQIAPDHALRNDGNGCDQQPQPRRDAQPIFS